MRRWIAVPITVAALPLLSGVALAQAGRSMDIDTSVRSAGMAGASTAVFFGDDLNSWANPALLGYAEGIRYQRGRTQLIPGLASDVFFDTEHVRFGGGGVGVVVSGRPVLDGVDLDYGSAGFSSFHSTESVESWGFGVSLARATEALMRMSGRTAPGWSHRVDVSLGMNLKRTDIRLSPTLRSTGNTFDLGVLVRGTVLDRRETAKAMPMRIDLAVAYAMINAGDERFEFQPSGGSAPPTRQHRIGFAARCSLDPPIESLGPIESRPWFLRGLTPLLDLGYSTDVVGAGEARPGSRTWWTEGFGLEAAFLGLISMRVGYYNDKEGQVQDPTFGVGIALPIGNVAGVRFDHASFPQTKDFDLPSLSRNSFTTWVDPLEIWRLTHADRDRSN